MNTDLFLKQVPLKAVEVTDGFWKPIMETTGTEMLPYQWRVLNDLEEDAEKSYCIRNFRIAAGLEEGEFYGKAFQDSDLAKWIEAAAYSLYHHPDKQLEQQIDEVIELIAKAQQPDGYLGTFYTINDLKSRWTNLMKNHELYCAGHMLEAAVAYYEATGKRVLLDVMIRFVDYIDSVMGPEEGKLHAYPGHEEIELALIRLYHITGDEKHLKLAKYFIDERGKQPCYFQQEIEKYNNEFRWENSYFRFNYYQAGAPVREMEDAVGHAVRAVYLYTAMADVAKETNDDSLLQACERMWKSIVEKQMYITGSIGSSSYGEAFTTDYDLPNDLIYGETCAAVGMSFFAERMLRIHPMGQYGDILEKLLYNSTISGMSLDGKRFFYVNPLEVVPELNEKVEAYRHVKPVRQKWFSCACCPPNLARLVESLGTYIYGVRDNTLFVHLYIGSRVQQKLSGGNVLAELKTEYPWYGRTTVTITAESDMEAALRIPGWCSSFTLSSQGSPLSYRMQEGYAYVQLPAGQTEIEVNFEMQPKIIRANPKVREDFGKAAVQRGPIVYCLEETDNGNRLHLLSLPEKVSFTEEYRSDFLGGVVVLTANGIRYTEQEDCGLYYEEAAPNRMAEQTLTFVPYYSWNNREPGEMTVWVRKPL